jgi:uncharacterized membrane protein
MKELSKIKKKIYLLISAILILLVVLICNVKFRNGNPDYTFKRILAEEFSTLTFFNCHEELDEKGNKIYVPDNDDPQVYLSVTDERINCVKINFADHLVEDTSIVLFYCREGESFAIENITDIYVSKGADSAVLFIPEDRYAILRLDINGTYGIKSVDLGIANNTGSIYSGFYEFDIIALVLLLIILILLILFERKLGYYAYIKTMFHIGNVKVKDLTPVKYIKKYYFNCDTYIEKKENAKKTANCFAGLALVFGMIFIYLVPPSSCPDEYTHFANICRISSGNFFEDTFEGQRGSFLKPEEIAFIEKTAAEYAFDAYRENKFSNDNGYNEFTYKNQSMEFRKDKSNINPMAYFSSAFGVVIIKLLFGISNPYILLLWAKLSNLIFSIIVIRLAILKTPILRNTMFLLALMPMTIYQLTSVSYDVEAICGSFLLFAYATRIILSEDSYIVSKQDIIAVCFSCVCLFASKIVYVPLIILLLAISQNKFGSKKRYISSILLVILTGILFYLFPSVINSYIGGKIENIASVEQQRNFLLSNLEFVPTILINSFKSQVIVWANSFVGVFGWVRIYMAEPFVLSYLILLMVTAFFELCLVKRFPVSARVFMVIGNFIVISGIIFAMYIGWTPLVKEVGGSVAFGVQGRYFIPVAIFSGLYFANPSLCRFKYVSKVSDYIGIISKFVVTAYLFLLVMILLTTYWL